MNILKKFSLLLICAISTFSYADEGKLVIGVEASREPFVYLNNQGKVEGFEVDLLTAIAKENGMEIEFSDMPFDALLYELLENQKEK